EKVPDRREERRHGAGVLPFSDLAIKPRLRGVRNPLAIAPQLQVEPRRGARRLGGPGRGLPLHELEDRLRPALPDPLLPLLVDRDRRERHQHGEQEDAEIEQARAPAAVGVGGHEGLSIVGAMTWVGAMGFARRPLVVVEDHLHHVSELLEVLSEAEARQTTVVCLDRPGPDTTRITASWLERYPGLQVAARTGR